MKIEKYNPIIHTGGKIESRNSDYDRDRINKQKTVAHRIVINKNKYQYLPEGNMYDNNSISKAEDNLKLPVFGNKRPEAPMTPAGIHLASAVSANNNDIGSPCVALGIINPDYPCYECYGGYWIHKDDVPGRDQCYYHVHKSTGRRNEDNKIIYTCVQKPTVTDPCFECEDSIVYPKCPNPDIKFDYKIREWYEVYTCEECVKEEDSNGKIIVKCKSYCEEGQLCDPGSGKCVPDYVCETDQDCISRIKDGVPGYENMGGCIGCVEKVIGKSLEDYELVKGCFSKCAKTEMCKDDKCVDLCGGECKECEYCNTSDSVFDTYDDEFKTCKKIKPDPGCTYYDDDCKLQKLCPENKVCKYTTLLSPGAFPDVPGMGADPFIFVPYCVDTCSTDDDCSNCDKCTMDNELGYKICQTTCNTQLKEVTGDDRYIVTECCQNGECVQTPICTKPCEKRATGCTDPNADGSSCGCVGCIDDCPQQPFPQKCQPTKPDGGPEDWACLHYDPNGGISIASLIP